MGHGVKSPVRSYRWLLASVRGQRGCHIIRSEEGVSPSFERRLFVQRLRTLRLHHLRRPSGGTTGLPASRPDLSSFPHAMAATSLVQRKVVPSIHMRWRMTPSFRARATRAFFAPRRLATAIAQLLSGDIRTVRVSITLAAS